MRHSVATVVWAALLLVAHARAQVLPPTQDIVRMLSEGADVEAVDVSGSAEDDDATRAKKSYAPPKQFCIEIRPKDPTQSPFVVCEPPASPSYGHYPYPQPYHYQYPQPYQYPPPPPPPPTQSTGSAQVAALHSLSHSNAPYQRAIGQRPVPPVMPMPMMMGGIMRADAVPAIPPPGPMAQPPMEVPAPGSPMPPPTGPLPPQPRPQGPAPPQPPPPSSPPMMPNQAPPPQPPVSGRSAYQPYYYPPQYPYSYEQPSAVTMQCHLQPGYQAPPTGNPVALLQLFLKPSHHHHHHPSYNPPPPAGSAAAYRAAAGGTTPKPTPTTAGTPTTPAAAGSMTTAGPMRIDLPMVRQDAPHVTPTGSHPQTQVIPGITADAAAPIKPDPAFRPGGGEALLKPVNGSAPKMAEDDDINMVDSAPMGRAEPSMGPPVPNNWNPMGRASMFPAGMPENIVPSQGHFPSGHHDMTPVFRR